jgi:hypothetical protein
MCPQRLLRLEAGICVGIGAQAEGAEPGKRCGVHPGVFAKSAQEIEIKGDGLTVSAKDAETDREGWQMKAEPVQVANFLELVIEGTVAVV